MLRHPDQPKVDSPEDTDQNVSKEEEERYHKLQQENEQLQQLITSRESKLKMLNQRLVERNSAASNGSTVNIGANLPTTVHPLPIKKNRCARLKWKFN